VAKKCTECERHRDLERVIFGDKETNFKGLVEQMSEVKEVTEDVAFWRKFISILFSSGAFILLAFRLYLTFKGS